MAVLVIAGHSELSFSFSAIDVSADVLQLKEGKFLSFRDAKQHRRARQQRKTFLAENFTCLRLPIVQKLNCRVGRILFPYLYDPDLYVKPLIGVK